MNCLVVSLSNHEPARQFVLRQAQDERQARDERSKPLVVSLSNHEPAGVTAGLILALYAPAIFFDGLIQKSVLDVFLVSVMLWLLASAIDEPSRSRTWVAAGALVGLLSLTRENALVFAAAIALWLTVTRLPVPRTRAAAASASPVASCCSYSGAPRPDRSDMYAPVARGLLPM